MNELLMNESKFYSDILNVNVEENYHKLTLKTYYNLLWISHFCTKAKVIYFTDCDTIFFPDRCLRMANLLETSNDLITGNCWMISQDIERNSDMPKYVPLSLWDKSVFPPFCSGAAHFMTADVIGKLLNVIPNISVNLEWLHKMDFLDDVVYTGILREWAGIKIVHSWRFVWSYLGFDSASFCENKVQLKHFVCRLKIITIVNSVRPWTTFQKCYENMAAIKQSCKYR